ncbi:hypothetical protein [Moorena sp. SIO3H5]|uniref:hypothetical protein n=1 Tax=Moorena sp. SIO3H5 TaxID=2607834 RepID=UPI0013BDF570|nr:hypothetical protein [Moorena sp. SIO3H5]NEO73862.1 hypothetical protein [Moorena sp. SIO3H5]
MPTLQADLAPCSLFPVPYSLFPVPCSLFPTSARSLIVKRTQLFLPTLQVLTDSKSHDYFYSCLNPTPPGKR